MNISDLLTISIATKDRPQVLDKTLRKLHEFGLEDCPLIICDDGSSPPLQPTAMPLFSNAKLIRNEKPYGQAYGRNRIARECSTRFVLQLDDDSYPESGSISKLLAMATKSSDWLAIAIPFSEPTYGRDYPTGIANDSFTRVRSFVGCSALIHTGHFLELGGYATWLEGMVEEDELSLRGLSNGKSTLSIDVFRIRHDVTGVNRDTDKIAARSYRNWVLLWILHAPVWLLPSRLLHLLASAVVNALKQRSVAALDGYFTGLLASPSIWPKRSPATRFNYKLYRSMPHSLDFIASRK